MKRKQQVDELVDEPIQHMMQVSGWKVGVGRYNNVFDVKAIRMLRYVLTEFE